MDQLIAEGSSNAKAAKQVISNLDEYLSACQLGITITALGIGWLGEPTLSHLLSPLLDQLGISGALTKVLSVAISFAVVTFINVVVGELAPKTFAIQKQRKSLYYLFVRLYSFIK